MDDNAIYFAKTDVSYTNNENTGSYDCTCDLEITNYNFKTGTVNKQAFETLDIGANWANPISTFGVDSYGRYYIATNEDKLYLFNSEGKLLSTTKCGSEIYEFAGFDKTNGNFYYRGSENWRYWGYDHSMASLKAGKVNSDNSITIKGENMMYLYQDGWFAHKAPIRMLNDRYLVSVYI